MTSSNGSIFFVTGPLGRESTGHRWIPSTKASDAELFYWTSGWTNNRDAGDLISHRIHYDVIAGCNVLQSYFISSDHALVSQPYAQVYQIIRNFDTKDSWTGIVNDIFLTHHCDVIMGTISPHHCLLNRLFRRRSKKTSKLRVTGLCAGSSPGTGEFPAQMASNVVNVSIWWRHHDLNVSEPSPPFQHQIIEPFQHHTIEATWP